MMAETSCDDRRGSEQQDPHSAGEDQSCSCWTKVNKILINMFHKIGYIVGSYPVYFIVFPLLISIGLSTGLFFITYIEDPIELFVPFRAPSLLEQERFISLFPVNYSGSFSASRFTRHEGHSRVIITARDGGSILRSELWDEIMQVDQLVNSIPVVDENGRELFYQDICAKWKNKCTVNTALSLNDEIHWIENGSTPINYPLMLFPLILPQTLGGIEINETVGVITEVKAILLFYFTNVQTQQDVDLALDWETNMIKMINSAWYPNILVSLYTSRSIQDELRIKMDSCLPFLPLTGFIMTISCMLMLWMSDCVRSKPFIGIVGIFSSMMAAGASFGFLIYIGASYTRLNVVVLFLVLGIGVDDMFVAISAWQKTSLSDSIPKRVAKTYSDAAVSVTITSVTNCLAFGIGTTTPIFIVKNFCLYCGVTIAFAYFWFITFCGGFLAIAGYMEENRRHSLFFVKVKPLSKSDKKNIVKRFLFSSDLVEQDQIPGGALKVKAHSISVFFRDTIGDLLQKTWFKVIIVLSCLAYLGGAIYGLTILKQGLYRDRMARDDSYLTQFSRFDELYFRHLPYQIQVAIEGNLTYSDPETQKQLDHFISEFENSPFGSERIFTQAWMRSYNRRLRRNKRFGKNVTDEASYIKTLKEKYFKLARDETDTDVIYNEDSTRIIASRFLVQVGRVKDVFEDVIMMNMFRKIAEDSPFNATVYHPLFNLFDQHDLMKELTLQSIVIAVLLVMFVSIVFIPNPWGSIGIAFNIMSIAIGVIGYMAFWDTNLDHVSVGSIFMCIGFSVDFSAHISYTFLSSKAVTVEGRIRESLAGLGLPIVQGATTTILSLITFLAIPGYGYRTFFKTIFMVNLFAIFHSIFLIPLFLSWLTGSSCGCRGKARQPLSKIDYAKKQMHNGNHIAITSIRPLDEDYIHYNGTSVQNGKTYGATNGTVNGSANGNGIHYSNGSAKITHHNGLANGKNHKKSKNSKNYAKKMEVIQNGFDNKAFISDGTD